MVHSRPVDCTDEEAEARSNDPRLQVGSMGPIKIRPDSDIRSADVRLRPMRPFDPPVLLALPDVRTSPLGADRDAVDAAFPQHELVA